MKFGIMINSQISDWKLICFAEELGFDAAWATDSQMIFSDCYATLALAAHHTSRIRLGTGLSVVATRIAPVTAHSIASINQLAPGRVHLALGTGHTGMRIMGFDPAKAAALADHARVVRALLHGETATFTMNGETHEIDFLHKDRGFINITDKIPIYIAAEGPLGQKAAGAYGDGWLTPRASAKGIAAGLSVIKAGAEAGKRSFPSEFPIALVTTVCVLRHGEPANSERVLNQIGAQVTNALHIMWEAARSAGNEDRIPPPIRDVWDQYVALLKRSGLSGDALRRRVHLGHMTFATPEERSILTPEAVKLLGGFVGEPDEILARLRKTEANGVTEISLTADTAGARDNYADFARLVMARY